MEPSAPQLLIVDDEPSNRQLLILQVGRLGFEAVAVAGGQEALDELTEEHRYAAVLIDLQMPHMDGFETTVLLRQREAIEGRERIPVVAVTAHTLADVKPRLDGSGIDGLLTKPLRPQVLVWELEHFGVRAPRGYERPATPTLDAATLKRLERMGAGNHREQLTRLIEQFRSKAGEAAEQALQASRARDGASVARAARQLDRAGRSIGATRLSSLSADLEQLAAAGFARSLEAYAHSLVREVELVDSALQALDG
ncbi:MAG: response regulator [Myxococcales bacterium]|nr:response regulator [Myxococcales bacterium]